MEDSPSKPSVAELAGRLKGHILPMPATNDEFPFRGRPPCSLKLHNQREDNEESDKTIVSPNPFRLKMKNSSIIEKLQANLALSPTSLLPSPKSPEVKLQPSPSPPTTTTASPTPRSPLSPNLRPSRQSSEEEEPVCFDSPAEGSTLSSINKTRARLSFKRRPPTRLHRRSAGEEAGAFGSALSPCDPSGPVANGDKEPVFSSPAEEEDQCGQQQQQQQPGGVERAGDRDRDCEQTKDKVANRGAGGGRGEEEQEARRARSTEASEEDRRPLEPCPAPQTEVNDMETEDREEEMSQEEECEERM